MVERLGLVLYWLGCGLAVVTGGLAVLGLFTVREPDKPFVVGGLFVLAGVVWAVGRACKFVLTGR